MKDVAQGTRRRRRRRRQSRTIHKNFTTFDVSYAMNLNFSRCKTGADSTVVCDGTFRLRIGLVVAQLAERSITTKEIHDSNPVTQEFY